MPVKIIKYTCAFKCGARAKSTIRQANVHESVCFKNPENKTCTTCNHEIYNMDGDGFREWMNRECKHPKGSEEFDELHEKSGYHTTPAIHINPVRNCPYWETKSN